MDGVNAGSRAGVEVHRAAERGLGLSGSISNEVAVVAPVLESVLKTKPVASLVCEGLGMARKVSETQTASNVLTHPSKIKGSKRTTGDGVELEDDSVSCGVLCDVVGQVRVSQNTSIGTLFPAVDSNH